MAKTKSAYGYTEYLLSKAEAAEGAEPRARGKAFGAMPLTRLGTEALIKEMKDAIGLQSLVISTLEGYAKGETAAKKREEISKLGTPLHDYLANHEVSLTLTMLGSVWAAMGIAEFARDGDIERTGLFVKGGLAVALPPLLPYLWDNMEDVKRDLQLRREIKVLDKYSRALEGVPPEGVAPLIEHEKDVKRALESYKAKLEEHLGYVLEKPFLGLARKR